MEIANTEFRPLNVDREVYFATSAEILDVAVSTVLRSAWDGSCAFFADLCFDFLRSTASMDVLRLGRLRDDPLERGGADQLAFAPVPFRENFGRGCTSQDTRVDQTSSKLSAYSRTKSRERLRYTREADSRYMSR